MSANNTVYHVFNYHVESQDDGKTWYVFQSSNGKQLPGVFHSASFAGLIAEILSIQTFLFDTGIGEVMIRSAYNILAEDIGKPNIPHDVVQSGIDEYVQQTKRSASK